MKKLLFILFGIFAISCKNQEVKQKNELDSSIPYCDTLKAKIKYVKGDTEIIDTNSVVINCGLVDSTGKKWVKAISQVIKNSKGEEIQPSDITWSKQK